MIFSNSSFFLYPKNNNNTLSKALNLRKILEFKKSPFFFFWKFKQFKYFFYKIALRIMWRGRGSNIFWPNLLRLTYYKLKYFFLYFVLELLISLLVCLSRVIIVIYLLITLITDKQLIVISLLFRNFFFLDMLTWFALKS